MATPRQPTHASQGEGFRAYRVLKGECPEHGLSLTQTSGPERVTNRSGKTSEFVRVACPRSDCSFEARVFKDDPLDLVLHGDLKVVVDLEPLLAERKLK